MKLTLKNMPSEISGLATDVRDKALEIGNTLMDSRYDTKTAIAIAVENAKNWAMVLDGQPAQHVIPHPNGWAVLRTDGKKPTYVLPTKQEAIDKAREIAKNQSSMLIIHGQDGWVQEKTSYREAQQ